VRLEIPIYVERRDKRYFARALFFPDISASSATLTRAIAKLSNEVRFQLDQAAEEPRHDLLAACTFEPAIRDRILNMVIETPKHTFRLRVLMVIFEALGRRIAHLPAWPEIWIALERGENVEAAVEEALAAHLRKMVKDDEPLGEPAGQAWLDRLEVRFHPPQSWKPSPPPSLLALLSGVEKMDGERQLREVGRRLDDLYPDELERAVLRERELHRLQAALEMRERRPVLVRGPRRAGKTALIHEAVFRRNEVKRRRDRGSVWSLSPARLIAGMMFVGQWESRLVAILDAARKHEHVLYFDDLLGLFSAGVSASSTLSVANVLKPWVERRDVRILGEITPEAFRVLQERDRGLADMFEIVTLDEPPGADAVRIAVEALRQAERRHEVRFEPDTIPLALDLQRRYVRDAAFPGKACVFLQRLAARRPGRTVGRSDVLEEFHLASGLSLQMLDVHRRVGRDEVMAALEAEVIGQEDALAAMADVVAIAKARIADPTRPLASLLFLGPTGVGKTQCARALARFLFGDEERMIRFDMSEFVSRDAASRLVGTFAAPDGLLTAAVRRSPFCVLLLDEIEKAHPDVFNLLLAVLGDGRLTDARGRTVDFAQAIVIMTSNLGAAQAAHPLGFRRPDDAAEALGWRRAAEEFFAPEFFNRLDRIVPFQRLGRAEIERIARQLTHAVLGREGLVRRRCILQIDRRVLDGIVEEGYHPTLGARALKRAVERRVAQPIAARLAGMGVGGATVIALFPSPDGATALIQPLRAVRAGERADVSQARPRLDALEARVDALSPEGPVDSERIGAREAHYYRLRQGLERARGLLRRIEDPRPRPSRPRKAEGPRRALPARVDVPVDLLDDRDLQGTVRRIVARAPDLPELGSALMRDVAMMETVVDGDEEEALVWIRGLDEGSPGFLDQLLTAYEKAAEQWLDLDAERIGAADDDRALCLRGIAAWRLIHGEHGTHLFIDGERLSPVSVVTMRVAAGKARVSLDVLRAGRRQWVEALERGESTVHEAPHPLGDVVRIYSGGALDLRSGIVVSGAVDGAAARELILGGLG
jgi:ATP-dependent Clp protease ATP-binding subunit ClpA